VPLRSTRSKATATLNISSTSWETSPSLYPSKSMPPLMPGCAIDVYTSRNQIIICATKETHAFPRVNSRSINLDVGQGVVQGSPLRGAVVSVFVPGPWQYLTQKLLRQCLRGNQGRLVTSPSLSPSSTPPFQPQSSASL